MRGKISVEISNCDKKRFQSFICRDLFLKIWYPNSTGNCDFRKDWKLELSDENPDDVVMADIMRQISSDGQEGIANSQN